MDGIAHLGKPGVEPLMLEVQAQDRSGLAPAGRSASGHAGRREYGLLITLGAFSRQSVAAERNRPKLRLIDGETLVEMLPEPYLKRAPRHRSLIPLKQIHVPDLQG